MAQSNRSLNISLVLLLSCGLITSSGAIAAETNTSAVSSTTELNNAQKAVRMQQFDKAFNLYQIAAKGGNSDAQYQLSNMLLQGKGTTKNQVGAKIWLEKAAQQSHPGAQFSLAQMLLKSDPSRAHALLKASADQGYASAKTQLSRSTMQNQSSKAASKDQAPYDKRWFGAARNNQKMLMQELLTKKGKLGITDGSGRNALFYATESGSEDVVIWLIKQGIEVNHLDDYGLTAAQTALERNQIKIFGRLLQAGTDSDQIFSNGDNLLHYAIRLKRHSQVSPLIRHGVSINHRNEKGWTPLDLAEFQREKTTVSLLKSHGAVTGKGWQSGPKPQNLAVVTKQLEGTSGKSPAALAVINSNTALLAQLLKQSPGLVSDKLENDTTLLVLAIKQNKPDVITTLLSHGADVNQPSYNGTTALQVAARTGNEEIVSILLKAGANPTQVDNSKDDALVSAIKEKQHDVAILLINHLKGDSSSFKNIKVELAAAEAPVDRYVLLASQYQSSNVLKSLLPFVSETTAIDEQQRNALWFAAKYSNPKLIRSLLNAGISATQQDTMGRTSMTIAVDQSCLECARQLLNYSDLNHKTLTGNTALILAATNKDPLLSSWLIQNKVKIDVRNHRGNTALMMAVTSNSPKIVKQLINAKANITRKNKLGFSAIDLAEGSDKEIMALLKGNSVFGVF